MDKTTKINKLYKIAMGEPVQLSPAERSELSKYKVGQVGKPLTTKGNISQYVTAVDRGCHKTFYDWCLDNHKGDRRTKDGSAYAISKFNKGQYTSVALFGWLIWGMALYWIFDRSISAGGCAVAGAILTVILYKIKREISGFTCVLLPVIILAIIGSR